jgi:hypothetical protein
MDIATTPYSWTTAPEAAKALAPLFASGLLTPYDHAQKRNLMNITYNDVPDINVRIWETSVFVMAFSGLLYWYYFGRTKFLLGIYLGYASSFGWTWVVDQFFFLRLDFHPASFGGFEIAGHWEPLWTAISYTALGIPAIHYLVHRENLKAKLGNYSLVPYLVAASTAIMFYEGLWGCTTLHVQSYNFRPEHLVWGKPWSNTILLEPLMLILPIFLANNVVASLPQKGPDAALPSRNGDSPVLSGRWSHFWMGFCAVQTGLYGMVIFMVTFLGWLQPWSAVRPIVF